MGFAFICKSDYHAVLSMSIDMNGNGRYNQSVKIHFLPKTKPGRWSIWLILGFILFYAVFFVFVAAGQRGGDTFFSNLYLTVPVVIAALSGISAFFVGIIGVIKDRERSILVYLTTLFGFCILLFCLAEIVFPH